MSHLVAEATQPVATGRATLRISSKLVRQFGFFAMDENWRKVQVEGLGPVSRVAATFHVGPPLAALPFAKFKVKIIENESGRFLGVTNVAIKASDGSPNWIAGLGGTIEEALADTLRYFKDSLEGRPGLSEDAFEWAASEDF